MKQTVLGPYVSFYFELINFKSYFSEFAVFLPLTSATGQ